MSPKAAHQMSLAELDEAIEELSAAVPRWPRASSGRQIIKSALLMFLLEDDRRQFEQARLRGQAKRERPLLHAIDGGRR